MNTNRRDFLRTTSLALSSGAAATFMPQLGLAADVIGTRGQIFGNYKALVCLYLAGGSDTWNFLVPRDSTSAGSRYTNYTIARSGIYNAGTNPIGLGLEFNSLAPINPVGQPAGSWGLYPYMTDYVFTPQGGSPTTQRGMAHMFNNGRMAILPNIGTLVRPMTKAQYNANSVARPPQLYSHNDQETLWGLPASNNSALPYGWGGEVASRVTDGNGLAALAPCISLSGSNRYQIGPGVFPYQMSSNGAAALSNYSGGNNAGAQRNARLQQLLNDVQYTHPFQKEYRDIMRRSLDLGVTITGGLTGPNGSITTPYQQASANDTSARVTYNYNGTNFTTSNSLLDQLRMVARMIKISKSNSGVGINHERQIYYVRLGGFDTHDAQMTEPVQPRLMARINQAVAWFNQAMIDLGTANEVTLFSQSEFARTLNSNNNGSDHAWGGVHFVTGGAVSGQRFVGTMPDISLNGPDSLSRGQFIPTTSSDQYAATLAQWFGLPAGEMSAVFPNIDEFATPTLNLFT